MARCSCQMVRNCVRSHFIGISYMTLRLGDLRDGRCVYGFFYNQVACCSGLDRECLMRISL
jgi:hypothetical protein